MIFAQIAISIAMDGHYVQFEDLTPPNFFLRKKNNRKTNTIDHYTKQVDKDTVS